jgi:hypothetical protein
MVQPSDDRAACARLMRLRGASWPPKGPRGGRVFVPDGDDFLDPRFPHAEIMSPLCESVNGPGHPGAKPALPPSSRHRPLVV